MSEQRHPFALKRGREIRLKTHLERGAKSGMRGEEEVIGLR